MNVAFFIYDGIDQKKVEPCIRSLLQYVSCRIILYARHGFNLPVEQRLLDDRWDFRRMTHRMEIASELPVKIGDRVISSDVDVFFQGDPFQVFNTKFDLFYTTRDYECDSPVNAGIWGFVKNARSDYALQFMLNQVLEPTWEPYLLIRERLEHTARAKEIDWWTNQDLLCAIHEAGLKNVATYDAGSRYNCCPRTGPHRPLTQQVIDEFKASIGDPHNIVIHYKELEGRL